MFYDRIYDCFRGGDVLFILGLLCSVYIRPFILN